MLARYWTVLMCVCVCSKKRAATTGDNLKAAIVEEESYSRHGLFAFLFEHEPTLFL